MLFCLELNVIPFGRARKLRNLFSTYYLFRQIKNILSVRVKHHTSNKIPQNKIKFSDANIYAWWQK